MSNFQLSITFFLQLALLLGACRLVGWAAGKFGQPQVVGEMIAGVLLGPSLFGLLAPGWQQAAFPRGASMTIIYAVAQLGLVLYMFLVGLEFRLDLFRARAQAAATISIAGMLVPFALGAGLAAWMLGSQTLFAEGVGRFEAMLFLGAALSITAFPMLARILYERGLTHTQTGTLALAAGAIDDAAAWCVLAIVLASFGNDPRIAALAIGGGAVYAAVLFLAGRPLLAILGRRVDRAGELRSTDLVLVLMLLMLAAWYTDAVGIYAVFGAFVLGACMPRGRLAEELERKLEPLTTHLLLPLFFVYSGLNTRIDLVDSPALWGLALLVLLIACLGKGVACWAAARLHGEGQRGAVAIGALMNARGLMELIILNIGLERGLITPQLFSIMVIMAIVTTLMATPVFELAAGTLHPRPARGARG